MSDTPTAEEPAGIIRPLPETVANQIAAGEVIERPASVVKELVENALDAEATRIEITVEHGGAKLIEVSDNGCGMSPTDAQACLQRQATSKLRTSADIEHIGTFGFRGEAIPSIASVARFLLTTRKRGTDAATEVRVTGGTLEDVSIAGHPEGTTITVRDLFFNVPARRKFLRTAATELARIRQTLNAIALAHPETAFRLKSEGRDLFRLPEGDTEDDRIRKLMGEVTADAMLPIDWTENGIHVSGRIARPDFAAVGTPEQYIFINRRPATAPQLQYALRQAWPVKDRRPVVVLFVDLPPEEVDVNVHPAKREVRFRRGNRVIDAVIGAIACALLRRPTEAAAPKRDDFPLAPGRITPTPAPAVPTGAAPAPTGATMPPPPVSAPPKAPPLCPLPPLPTPQAPAPRQEELPLPPFARGTPAPMAPLPHHAFTAPAKPAADKPAADKPNASPTLTQTAAAYSSLTASSIQPSPAPSAARSTPLPPYGGLPTPQAVAPVRDVPPPPPTPPETSTPPTNAPWAWHRVADVLDKGYWLVVTDQGYVTVDAKAATERILYEQLLPKAKQDAGSQPLLIPESLRLPPIDAERVSRFLPELAACGFGVSTMGDDTFMIDALPLALADMPPKTVLTELAAELDHTGVRKGLETWKREVVARAAAKAAAGTVHIQSIDAANNMMARLARCTMPYTTPRGNPVMILTTYRELARRFRH